MSEAVSERSIDAQQCHRRFRLLHYLSLLGLILVVAPNTLLGVFRIAETREVWIRVVGVLALPLAFLSSNAARRDVRERFGWSVIARTGVLPLFTAIVVAGIAPPILILFGLIDFVAALWTAFALRAESRPRSA